MNSDFESSFSLDMGELDALLDEERKRMNHTMKLEVVQFTDPLCGWCYGMEPAMTKLRFQLGDQLDFSYTLGLMVPSVSDLIMAGAGSSESFEAMKQMLAYGYAFIERSTGMPMSVARFDDIQLEDMTSLQSSLGYEAVKLVEGPDRAIDFMRLLRQSLYAFDVLIGSRESVAQIAQSFSVDMEAYNDAIDSGAAERALGEEVRECRSMSIASFPTLLITYGSVRAMVNGYQSPADLASIISQVTEGSIELDQPEYSEHRALDLLDRFGRVAGEEIRVVFNLTPTGLIQALDELTKKGLVDIALTGRGLFISRR